MDSNRKIPKEVMLGTFLSISESQRLAIRTFINKDRRGTPNDKSRQGRSRYSRGLQIRTKTAKPLEISKAQIIQTLTAKIQNSTARQFHLAIMTQKKLNQPTADK
jgi:hypothetical protein